MLDCVHNAKKTAVVTFAYCKLETLKYDNEPSDRPTEYDWVVRVPTVPGWTKVPA